MPSQCSDIINSKLPEANYTWISLKPPSSSLWWHWLLKKFLGLVVAWKSGLKKVPLLPLVPSYPLQTIFLSDLVGCDLPLETVMAVWRNFFFFWGPNSHYCQQWAVSPDQKIHIEKSVPNCHYYLQRAVTPDWMGSIALSEQITDINNRLFLMNKKGLMTHLRLFSSSSTMVLFNF